MGEFPRLLTEREVQWLDFLLPESSPGYREFRQGLRNLMVLGEGRWGENDLILGHEGEQIDLTEGMYPTVSSGEIIARGANGTEFTITLSVHQPNSEGMVEFQVGTPGLDELPGEYSEISRWSYAGWSPGNECPATGGSIREISLNPSGDLLLAISPVKGVVWLYDGTAMTSTLIPVSSFYNEIMLLRRQRDPSVALDYKRLFTELESFNDAELRDSFVRYNNSFRKVDPDRLLKPQLPAQPQSLLRRIAGVLGRKQ